MDDFKVNPSERKKFKIKYKPNFHQNFGMSERRKYTGSKKRIA
jgi:hypothetical protein